MSFANEEIDNNKKLVIRFIEDCWNAQKLGRVPEMVAAHCRHHDPVFPHLNAGVETLQRHISACHKTFPNLNFTITDTIGEKNEVVIHWTVTGTLRGLFFGMPATNETALIPGTSIYRIENGKIVEQWMNWDMLSLMQQLGINSVPARQIEVNTRV